MSGESQDLELLLASLVQPDKRQIRKAVDALIALAPQQPDLTRRLEGLLAAAARENCWPIAYILGNLPNPSSPCLEALLAALNHDDPDIRWAVALLLGRLGKSDRLLAERLLALGQSGTPQQRRMVIYCLRASDPSGGVFWRALKQAIHDAEPLVRVAAVTSLKLCPDAARESLDLLIGALHRDPDSRVQCAAAITLPYLEGSGTIRAALEKALDSGNLQLQKACRAALELMKKKEPVPPTR
jgi:HEAT repeat protein